MHWEPTPYRTHRDDRILDTQKGRYRILPAQKVGWFSVRLDGVLLATCKSFDASQKYVEQHLISGK